MNPDKTEIAKSLFAASFTLEMVLDYLLKKTEFDGPACGGLAKSFSFLAQAQQRLGYQPDDAGIPEAPALMSALSALPCLQKCDISYLDSEVLIRSHDELRYLMNHIQTIRAVARGIDRQMRLTLVGSDDERVTFLPGCPVPMKEFDELIPAVLFDCTFRVNRHVLEIECRNTEIARVLIEAHKAIAARLKSVFKGDKLTCFQFVFEGRQTPFISLR